jgi:hypothetical protein
MLWMADRLAILSWEGIVLADRQCVGLTTSRSGELAQVFAG